MSYPMPGHAKLCGTCAYWIGQRQPNFYGNAVMLESQSVKGKCWCLNGPFARADKYSNTTTCSCYKKWEILK